MAYFSLVVGLVVFEILKDHRNMNLTMRMLCMFLTRGKFHEL